MENPKKNFYFTLFRGICESSHGSCYIHKRITITTTILPLTVIVIKFFMKLFNISSDDDQS